MFVFVSYSRKNGGKGTLLGNRLKGLWIRCKVQFAVVVRLHFTRMVIFLCNMEKKKCIIVYPSCGLIFVMGLFEALFRNNNVF